MTHRSAATTVSSTAEHDGELFGSSAGGVAASAEAGILAGSRSISSRGSGTTASSRPMSALYELRDLRGSRPNSAAIAAQIEGFDADFLVGVVAFS